jgi:hypothetical protein
MAFDQQNRQTRRAAQAYARAEQKNRPARLTEIPREEWPRAYALAEHPPTHVWVSQKYLVQMFDEEPFQGIDTRRLSINRSTLKSDGHWDEDLVWTELQAIKREIGFGDWYGVEIYPRDRDVVNVANLRHLWILAAPLNLGWFNGERPLA